MKKKIIINTSTFANANSENTPGFINSLVDSLSSKYSDLEIIVLRPMINVKEIPYKEFNYIVKPYRYFWPLNFQTLHKYGLKPSIDKNKLNVVKVSLLIICQFFALLKLIRKEKPDYIYAQWFMPQGFVTAVASNFTSAKFYCSSYGADVLIFKNMKLVGRTLIKYIVKKCHKFTAISDLSYSLINDCVNSNEKLMKKGKVIPLPIDDFFFSTQHSEQKFKNNFLYIGRLVDYKGVDLLIESFNLLDTDIEFTLNILGDGVDREFLIDKVKELKLDNKIFFHGWKNGSEKLKFITKSDVVFIPSVQTKVTMEGGPLTLIEALSQKKIVICSDSIGYGSYIQDEINGIKFKSGDVNDLVNSIKLYLGLSDFEKQKIASSGYEVSLKFKQKDITDKLYSFLFENSQNV